MTPQIKQNPNGIWMLEGEQLWDTEVLKVALEHINPGDTVIDAGAWIGGHTIAYAEKVGTDGRVIAFEPNPDAFTCLYRNSERFLNVRCDQIALGNHYGAVPFLAKKGWYDSGHIGEGIDKKTDVIMRPLDHYELAPNLIKIDVEGCELKLLKGAVKTIEKYRPVLVVEINKPALQRQGNVPQEVLFDFLGTRGYEWNIIKEGEHNPEIYNILALPK